MEPSYTQIPPTALCRWTPQKERRCVTCPPIPLLPAAAGPNAVHRQHRTNTPPASLSSKKPKRGPRRRCTAVCLSTSSNPGQKQTARRASDTKIIRIGAVEARTGCTCRGSSRRDGLQLWCSGARAR